MIDRLMSALTFGAVAPGDLSGIDLRDPMAREIFGGGRAGSGATVNDDTALTVSAWFRAIDLLSDSIAKAPVNVYAMSDKGKTIDNKHAWYQSLYRKPFAYMTSAAFWKLLVAWQRSAGNAYAYIDRQAFELIPIHPRRMVPQIKDGLLIYVLDNKQTYNADEVLHFRGLATDILGGMSVVDKAREALGLSISARDHQTNTLKNSARPNVLIKSPKFVPKIQRDNLLKEWQQMHQGGQNAGRTAILDNGLDVTPYAFTSQDMELMESQRFTVRDIANFTGVPAHKLGDATRAGYNSIEAENLSFLADTLEAILVGIEQELEDKLLFEEEKISGSRQIVFDRSVLSGTDTNTKATYWRTALGGHPWATVAEARKALNLNHEDGTDFIPAPANMGQGGEQNRPADPTGDFPKGLHLDGLKESTATALQAATQRLFRKLGNQAKAKAGKPGEFIALVDGLYGANVVAVLEDFLPLERAAGLAHGVDLAGKVGKQALRHAERQFKHVVDTTTAAGLSTAVEDVCRQFETFHLDHLPRA